MRFTPAYVHAQEIIPSTSAQRGSKCSIHTYMCLYVPVANMFPKFIVVFSFQAMY